MTATLFARLTNSHDSSATPELNRMQFCNHVATEVFNVTDEAMSFLALDITDDDDKELFRSLVMRVRMGQVDPSLIYACVGHLETGDMTEQEVRSAWGI